MTEPGRYPHQELLPQQVQPGRSRLPLVLAAAALVVALVVGLVVWRAVHGSGEQNRAAYCAALTKLTQGQGLAGLAGGASSGVASAPKVLDNLRDLAPGSVRDEWDDLVVLVEGQQSGTPDVGQIARAFSDVQAIIADANSGCGLSLQFPG